MLTAINASSTEVPLRDAYLPSIDSVFACATGRASAVLSPCSPQHAATRRRK
jgi:hypothetical protein